MPNWKKVITSGSDACLNSISVDSTTVVTNLNADKVDGCDASAFYLATNPSGYTTCTGTVTSVGTTGNVNGITLTGTVTTSGTLTLGGTLGNITVSQLAAAAVQTSGEAFSDSDTVLMTAAAVDDRITSYGYTTCTGDITGVTAGNGLTDGGTSGTVTLNVGAGTGIDVAADAISVDVSDFMTNGSNNRVVTATGTDAMNAEANLTFDGSTLTVTGNQTVNGNISASGDITASGILVNDFAVNETLTIGSQKFYAQGNNGFSVNEDFDPSNSALQTAYHFTSGTGRETVAFTLARTGQFTDGFGIYGTSSDNTFVMFGEQTNTSFEWRKGVGIRPLDLDGGTLLAKIDKDGNFTVTGTITAQEFHTEFVSASIIYQSGSTKFGDTLDDVHEFTGSLNVTGSIIGTLTGTASYATNADCLDGCTSACFYLASNPSGYTTCTGDITGVTAGTGLSGGGTSGTVTLDLDFSELTDMTGDISGTTEFILQNGSTESRKAASEIKLSNFNNDSGWTSCTGDITGVTAGTGLSGGGASGTVSLSVALDEISAGTIVSASGVSLAGDTVNTALSAINLSSFNNDSGFTTCTGDITGVTAGTGLSGGGASGDVTLNVDLSELTDMTATMVGTDEFIVLDAGADRRKAANEIGLSIFSNDSGFTTCTGTVTSVTVTAGSGLTGGGTITTSGTATLNIGAGTGIDVAADAISVDVSDFMSNGSNNRIVTATGTDAMNAEANLTFDGSILTVTGQVSATGITGSLLGTASYASNADLLDGCTATDFYLASNPSGYTTCTGDITGVTAGVGLSGGGVSGDVTLTVDLSELTDMTATMVGTDEFIVLDAGADRRKAANEIGLSIFSNDSGFTTCTGDITGVTAGVGLSGGGSSGDVSLALDFSELTDMTGDISGTTEFILQNGTTESRKAASEIKLSNFNNDSGWTSCTGTVTSVGVTAGSGLTGGGTVTTSGTITVNVGAGTGIDVAADAISVDVSDFMSNGSNDRIVTATGTDAMNAEANLTFNGSLLTVTGDAVITGTLTAQEFKTELISASVIFQSGSTIFGNSADDTHVFTGSVLIDGALEATTKSFVIDNPKKGGKLQYGVLEGPEHSVYYRGKTTENVVNLPEDWEWLVDSDTITVQLTPIKSFSLHSVSEVKDNKVYIESQNGEVNCYFLVHAERKDVPKLKIDL